VEFYRPTLLDPEKHQRDRFTSGVSSLDERRYAGQNRRRNTAAVWVIADGNHRVACYATLRVDVGGSSGQPRSSGEGARYKSPRCSSADWPPTSA
jgi:hypothetical protein